MTARTEIPNADVGVLITDGAHDTVVGYGRTETPGAAAPPGSKCNVDRQQRPTPASRSRRRRRDRGPADTPRATAEHDPRQRDLPQPDRRHRSPRLRHHAEQGSRDGPRRRLPGGRDAHRSSPGPRRRSSAGSCGCPTRRTRRPDDRRLPARRQHDQDRATAERGVMRPDTTAGRKARLGPDAERDEPVELRRGARMGRHGRRRDIAPDGRWRLEVPDPPVDDTDAFTATVTDAHGDTSEFSEFCADTDGDGDGGQRRRRAVRRLGAVRHRQRRRRDQRPAARRRRPYNADRDTRDVFVEVD